MPSLYGDDSGGSGPVYHGTTGAGMSECCHKLCHAPAVEAVDIRDSRLGNVFVGPVDKTSRHYELCAEHFARYFPRGVGYMARQEAIALQIQCKASG